MAMDSARDFPRISLRRRASQIGNVSKSLLHKIYKLNKVRPFKPRFIHTLEENDDMRRLDFCLWIGENIFRERRFVENIIFSDEATFNTNGTVSSQNSRYWSHNNPHFRIQCRRQYSKKINVWCAISYSGIIGPYFFESNLNQHTYLHMLNTFFHDHLNDIPLVDRRKLFFQQDGCPAHSTRIVREWLNQQFGDKWIGRNGPNQWPARSPDLTMMDFHLWGYLKENVYKENFHNNVDLLKDKIREVITNIPIHQIRNCYREFRYRVELCAELGGATFE